MSSRTATPEQLLQYLTTRVVYSCVDKTYIIFNGSLATFIPENIMLNTAPSQLNSVNVLNHKPTIHKPEDDELRKQELRAQGIKYKKVKGDCTTPEEIELFQISNRIKQQRLRAKKKQTVNVTQSSSPSSFQCDTSQRLDSQHERMTTSFSSQVCLIDTTFLSNELTSYFEGESKRDTKRLLTQTEMNDAMEIIKHPESNGYTMSMIFKSQELYKKLNTNNPTGLLLHREDEELMNKLHKVVEGY